MQSDWCFLNRGNSVTGDEQLSESQGETDPANTLNLDSSLQNSEAPPHLCPVSPLLVAGL